jgi:hypothetical protein
MDPKLQLFITFQLLTSLQMSFSKDCKKEKKNPHEALYPSSWRAMFLSDLTFCRFICYLRARGIKIIKKIPLYLINNNLKYLVCI